MNCSKVVAALLAIILMVVILSGCGGSTGTETQPTTSEPPAATTSAPPAVTTTTSTAAEPAGSDTVYIGETGTKFHTMNCQYLAGTKTPLTRDEAIAQGYTACPFCKP